MFDDELDYDQSLTPRITPAVLGLILVTVAVYVTQVMLPELRVPFDANAQLAWLGLGADQVARWRLWQAVSHFFIHTLKNPPIQIALNVILLYVFGRDLEVMLGARRFIAFYLAAGIGGGLIFLGASLATGAHAVLAGSASPVIGVMALYACYFPTRPVRVSAGEPVAVRVRMRWVIGGLVAAVLAAAVWAAGAGSLAALGGGALGLAYPRWSAAIENRRQRRRMRRESLEAESKIDEEKRLDEILEKVHSRGLHTLTRQEKKFLQEMSRKISNRT